MGPAPVINITITNMIKITLRKCPKCPNYEWTNVSYECYNLATLKNRKVI